MRRKLCWVIEERWANAAASFAANSIVFGIDKGRVGSKLPITPNIRRSKAMKLLVLSDLHVEFAAYQPDPAVMAADDVVVLAGDIHIGTKAVNGPARPLLTSLLCWSQETMSCITVNR